MGLISRMGTAAGQIGGALEGISEVFVPNATRSMELGAEAHRIALQTAAAEFEFAGSSLFDRGINGLNRLPRPLLALGTLGLFVYAMVDPVEFARRMVGLQEVPEPLWWLLGAIVSFYFGARELHHLRVPRSARAPATARQPAMSRDRMARDAGDTAHDVDDNPAISAWRNSTGSAEGGVP
jgi:hypothetical protein